jgi:hypothetical protein
VARLTRRAALATLGALGVGSFLGLRYVLRSVFELPSTAIRLTDGGGFMGAGHMDISRYMEMLHHAARGTSGVDVSACGTG